MSVSGARICRLADEAADAPDPESALRVLTQLRAEVDEFERRQVTWALRRGRSFGDVARALGVSRQAAHRRFRDLAPSGPRPGDKLSVSRQVRLALGHARAEAARRGAPLVEPQHLLLGLVRSGDRRAAAALHEAGLTLDDVEAVATESAPAGDPGDGAGARDVLASALHRAREEQAGCVGAEHLLAALLERLREPQAEKV